MNKLLFYSGVAFIVIGSIIVFWFLITPIHCPLAHNVNGTIVGVVCNNAQLSLPLYLGMGLLVLGVVLLAISFTKSGRTLSSHQSEEAKMAIDPVRPKL